MTFYLNPNKRHAIHFIKKNEEKELLEEYQMERNHWKKTISVFNQKDTDPFFPAGSFRMKRMPSMSVSIPIFWWHQ